MASLLILAALFFTTARATYCVLNPVTQIEIDYDSGNCRTNTLIGPLKIGTESGPTSFGSLATTNGLPGLTGFPVWKIALEFSGSRHISPNFIGGGVLHQIKRLEIIIDDLERNEAIQVKTRFLDALRKGGHKASQEYSEQITHAWAQTNHAPENFPRNR
ncbi:MAG TPA: hypothetical protein VHH73_05335 [Verrucomicrobiae bacterium]|nr:hypothetical protein [Verrucomicrobiae bacterium]